jgi:hypothetical protein
VWLPFKKKRKKGVGKYYDGTGGGVSGKWNAEEYCCGLLSLSVGGHPNLFLEGTARPYPKENSTDDELAVNITSYPRVSRPPVGWVRHGLTPARFLLLISSVYCYIVIKLCLVLLPCPHSKLPFHERRCPHHNPGRSSRLPVIGFPLSLVFFELAPG